MKLGKVPFANPWFDKPVPLETYGPSGFNQRVFDEIGKLDGWEVSGGTYVPDFHSYIFHFRCPHWNTITKSVTEQVLAATTSLELLAVHFVHEAKMECLSTCAPETVFAKATEAFVKEVQGFTESFEIGPLDPGIVAKSIQEQIAKVYGVPLETIASADHPSKPGVSHYATFMDMGYAKVNLPPLPDGAVSWQISGNDQPPSKWDGTMSVFSDLSPLDELVALWPALRTAKAGCPVPPGSTDVVSCMGLVAEQTIGWVVIHLNDYHAWSREKIADWLDDLPPEIDLTLTAASKGD
jgi:hypothetical protein